MGNTSVEIGTDSPPRKKSTNSEPEANFELEMDVDDDILSDDFIEAENKLKDEIYKLNTIISVITAERDLIKSECENSHKAKERELDDVKMENNKLQTKLKEIESAESNSKCFKCSKCSCQVMNKQMIEMPINKNHVDLLKGYRSVVKASPDGACLFNSTSLHLHKNESQSYTIRKKSNSHI